MLYSAEAVTLPASRRAPPIATTWRIRGTIAGASRIAIARFVIGPVTASGHRARRLAQQCLDDEVHRVPRRRRRRRLEDRELAEPRLAVEMLRLDERPHHWPRAAREHRHPFGRRARKLPHQPCVARRLRQ